MRGLDEIEEEAEVCSTIFGKGICKVLMDEKEHEFYINIHFKSGLEKAYNKKGKHSDKQIFRDLYIGEEGQRQTIIG